MPVTIGPFTLDRDEPALASEERAIVDRFHELSYRRWLAGAGTVCGSWMGYEVVKSPLDLWMYQELLVRTRPDVVVETGTYQGGSALFLAMVLEHLGQGRVITLDVSRREGRPTHQRISYLEGSSTDPRIVEEVKRHCQGRVFVILDSDHHRDHVYQELLLYSPLVQPGGYLVVEDTNVNGHPAWPEFGPGPMEAVEEFLAHTKDFVVDERCQRFLFTLNPRGYLRRRHS